MKIYITQYTEKLINGKWEYIFGFTSDMYDENDDYFSNIIFKRGTPILSINNPYIFALISDVKTRPGVKPISKPRGLPKDISNHVNVCSMFDCGFAFSWLTAQEIKNHKERPKHTEWLFNGGLNQLMERSDTGEGDDVRIIFWFHS